MNARMRQGLSLAVLAVLMFGPLGLAVWLLWVVGGESGREALQVAVHGHVAPLVALLLLVFVAGAMGMRALFRAYLQRACVLGEQIGTMAEANPALRLQDDVPQEFRAIVHGANALADHRDALQRDIEARVECARQTVEAERNRLAALMGELTQSVVVCNHDGRILLYNARARQQFRALSHAPEVADGGELIGLGRSIYTVLDRNVVQHAFDVIERQRRRGAKQPVANFVSARGSSLLRVRMSPVPQGAAHGAEGGDGFILLFDDITDDFERDRRRDQLVQTLTDEQRSALSALGKAIDALAADASDAAQRDRTLQAMRKSLAGITRRIDSASLEFAETVRGRWPLEEMQAEDLLEAARARIAAHTGIAVDSGGDGEVWLRVDSFSLLHALVFLAGRLVEAFELRELVLRVLREGDEVCLDLVWRGHAASTETLMSWELDPIAVDGHDSPLTVRDVLQRQGGEMSVQRDKARQQCFLRFSLPACAAAGVSAAAASVVESRPEYYDFDLFNWSEEAQALDEQLLSALSYTAFDTETTGLDPSGGDEIIQIGATRIVNGKLLRGESFEQLIDPRRGMSAESIAIHGIRPEMLVGQPDIAAVLPAFRAFAADTVLVAHNAAFDMRFLQLKEAATGVVFDLPVLDTLLLSALLHPNQESHRLEAIAERLGVTVVGRHTALGDALVTAEVFIRLLPLLAERGIRTLGQAREASEQTYYARLKY